VIVTGSWACEVLSTCTVKVTLAPGSLTEVGSAVLLTTIDGAVSTTVTVALSLALAAAPSSSWPEAVTVSVSESPLLPLIVTGKVHS
jgi:hypothetical protein